MNTPAINAKATSTATPGPAPTTDISAGGELYKTSCSKCHKEDGTGGKITIDGRQINPDDLTSAKISAKTDEKLTQYILEGFPEDGMPAFKGRLKDDQIKAIIIYIRTDLSKSAIRPPDVPAR
ncbi:MAG: cytochrome c [Acidobacteriota bacterium]